jgi:hypothetical protein
MSVFVLLDVDVENRGKEREGKKRKTKITNYKLLITTHDAGRLSFIDTYHLQLTSLISPHAHLLRLTTIPYHSALDGFIVCIAIIRYLIITINKETKICQLALLHSIQQGV